MKCIYFKKQRLLFVLCALTVFTTGCINDFLSECKYDKYSLTVKVVNAKGDDITPQSPVNEATLFVFDEQGVFVDSVHVDKATITSRTPIELDYPADAKLTVVGWGGLSGGNQEITALTSKTTLQDFNVSLFKNAGIAEAPDRLYHGLEEITTRAGELTADHEVVISPKVSYTHLNTVNFHYYLESKGLRSKADAGELNYILTRTPSKFDYKGNMGGDSVSYNPPAEMMVGEFVADSSHIVPNESFGLSLYDDGKLIGSRSLDDDNKPFRVGVDSILLIQIEFGKDGTIISAKTAVRPWGTVIQDVEF